MQSLLALLVIGWVNAAILPATNHNTIKGACYSLCKFMESKCITKQRISPNRVFDFCQMIQTRFIALATQYDSSAKPISISIGNYPASWKRVITE
ncbi:hypothetical protein GHT06_004675 [Daphnia sinensis]|uniref:Secreted protein n=1 Tax=Daphnia sinensis TaxID=1820382 RepID=A0AAD5KWB9_9CRUS|nr:hypothetical protein GHT06_005399 [Daphnia sinensis]KAI9550865.1 hypothetical protein GHT06_004675 [Daphnia sinensis]